MRRSSFIVSGCVFLATSGLASQALAATYSVGPSQEYKSLSEVVDKVNPGDVVEVDGDATYPGGVHFERSATAAAKITIRGVKKNGKRPILSGGANTIEAQGDHYVFEGLEITGGTSRCFFHHADDITIRDSVIHDCPKQGILGADEDSGSMLLEYSEVYKSGGGDYDHQIYMATDETAHPKSVFRMQFCYVHDGNGGHNVKSRAERNEIYYNWIEGAVQHELELIGPDGQDEALAREDSDVVGNVLVKKNTFFVMRFGGDGTGQTNGRYRFVNNTVIVQPSSSAVFRLFDGLESVEMHNNVFDVDGAGSVKLLRDVEASWVTGSEVIAGTNNWVRSSPIDAPTQWTGTMMGADPGLVSLADPQPAANSPLIGKGALSAQGVDGHLFPSPLVTPLFQPPVKTLLEPGTAAPRVTSTAIDVGAYAFGSPAPAGGTGGSSGSSGPSTSGSGAAGSGASSAGGSSGTAGAPSGVYGASSDGTSSQSSSGDSGSSGGCSVGAERSAGTTSLPALTLSAALGALAVARRKRARRAHA